MSTLNLDNLDRYYFKFKFLIYGVTYPLWGVISYIIITDNEPYWERFLVGAISFIYSFYCQKVIEKYSDKTNRVISQVIDLIVIVHYFTLVVRSEGWGENVSISYVFGFLVVMFATGFTSRSVNEIINWSLISLIVTILVSIRLDYMSPILFILFILTLVLFIMTIGVFSVKLLDQFKILNKNIESILQNLSQGIFTFDNELKIHSEYSQYLEKILGEKDLSNKYVMDILFDNTSLNVDQLDQIKNSILSFIGENSLNYHLNEHILPREIVKSIDGSEKVLALDWEIICDNNDVVEKTMVIIRDVTELRLLQLESEKHKVELKLIGEIVKNGVGNTYEFIESQMSYVDECEDLLKDSKNFNKNMLNTLFRNMHTIKGNARAFDLSKVVEVAHLTEQYYQNLKSEEVLSPDFQKMKVDLEALKANIFLYIGLIKDKIGFSQDHQEDGFHNKFYKLYEKIISNINYQDDLELKNALVLLEKFKKSQNYTSIPQALDKVITSLDSIAKELGKETPRITFSGISPLLSKDKVLWFRDIFTHLLRNGLDHGIETTELRAQKGKDLVGTISISITEREEFVEISLSDDGQGLNLEALKNKGLESKQINQNASNDQIAALIFSSGLSTAKEVSQISGRGVGMDAVKSFIEKEGGTISIELGNKLLESNVEFLLKIQILKRYFSFDQDLSSIEKILES